MKFALSVFVVLLLTLFVAQPVQAVDGEVTYTGTNTNLTGDDVGAGPFNLGFTFNFYGNNYTQAYININGTVNFSENYSRYDNQPLATTKSGTNISDNSVYAFWDDLNTNPSGGSGNRPIYYATIGSSPNRKFVAQWTNIYFHGTTVQMGTFQVILYEGSNDIQIQYRDLLGNASQLNRELGNSATIGLRKDNTYRNQYSHNSASITQGQAIHYTPNGSNAYTVDTSADYDLVYLAPAGAPTSPTLVTPTDGTTGVTLSPAFEWLPVESATSYRILISTVSNFATTVADQTTTGTSYTYGSNLNTSTQYYWRVQAINSNGSSLSPTRSFTTAAVSNTAPNTPSSITSNGLLNGASIASTSGKNISMTLSDTDPDEQVRYRLQMATDAAFNSLVIDYRSEFGAEGDVTYTYGQSGGTYLVGNSSTVLPNDEYYVRVRTEDDSAASSSWHSSGAVAFTLEQNAAPNVPSSLGGASLVNGSVLNSTQPTLSFSLSDSNVSNTVLYEIQVDDNSDFASPIIHYTSALGSQGSKSFVVGQVAGTGSYTHGSANQTLNNGDYYWRVRATDNLGDSSAYATAHSGAVAFTVNSNSPAITELTATVLSSSSAEISWQTDENTSSQVEYGLVTGYGFETAVSNTSPRVTSHTVVLHSLLSCARYFYRVKSVNNASTQTISERQTFTTSGCAVSTVTDGSEDLIADSGGEVEYVHNTTTARLVIPSAFYTESVQFQINLIDSHTIPAPPQTTSLAAGNIYKLVALTESGSLLNEFDEPVTLTFTYGEEMKSAFELQSLDIYRYNPDTEIWDKKSCSHNIAASTITCTLSNFSVYGIFGQPKSNATSVTSRSSDSRTSQNSKKCTSEAVISPPELFQVDGDTQAATLYFAPSSGGANQYNIMYGLTPEANQHGVSFSHSDTSGAVPYTIQALSSGTWYFRVQGNNGCAYSSWSNTQSVRVGMLPLATQNTLTKPVSKAEQEQEPSSTPEPQVDTSAQASPDSYIVRVKVLQESKPLQNVKITLAETEQEVITDDEGYAVFEKVGAGLKSLKLVGQAFAYDKEVMVEGSDKEFDVAITVVVNEDGISTHTWILIITGLFVGFSALFIVTRLKR